MTELIDVPAGLRNVVVTTTELGDVRGREGFYHYRQYDAIDLARHKTFEDVWFLFLEGRLPEPEERVRFAKELAPLRVLPGELREILPLVARAGGHPIAGLRTALSVLAAARDLPPLWDAGPDRRKADAMLVCAVTPTILAALHRLRAGLEPLEPRADLGAAANWLYLVSGAEPAAEHARAIEQYLIATVDHGFNASTFTARVVASCGADVVSAVAAALGAFSGPLHGGAPDRALASLDAIGTPDRIDAWVRARISAGDRIMGFGHAVYRTQDPRSVLLREIATGLGGDLADFATTVERRVVEILAELKPGRELYANVEFYAGVVMELCGLPRALFTPTFAVSRVVGWCANVLEQAAGSKIIRPAARYVGPPAPQPVS
ncbi:citrate synthase/methylcitrate synthase [Amycolatopsis thermalba]|uniref:Citrate synthase n=1 Tax=Amycolatopsis thermalba TaxID=944492 RepID=A0ABY4NS95_9PSEU|nr:MULTISPECIES: citrate/2-methylcitrate synthase [Amycolatopsis]OXM69305.1 citrate synthase/methylcitrate synthase [Amycolatopsis sp. KNN50.9b]UQS22951.1 citrate synthase/methylcitrate synthase [Amycolatopsis thermalba]